ncbi:MAG TPA: class I SAM-dependent methyltransferase [Gaiella sp.]|jgi:SAM-dependent methyltransferase|nr:class I SAM-dependent methyltransferase [Gaiella sp.]
MRGWGEPFRASLGLGLRQLGRRRHLREAIVRLAVPMDPSRYLEIPWALRRLGAARGEHVLDLASPKLFCVVLARHGIRVTSVDQLSEEIEKWQEIARDEPNLVLRVGDGRALPFDDESFDHATSISVLEHVGGDRGDEEALRELARCVRPGGRLALTLPHAPVAWAEYRSTSAYVDEGARDEGGRVFFQRWYDDEGLDRLVGAIDSVELVERDVVRLSPNLNAAYVRTFPLLVPLGLFYGLLARERRGEDGDVVRLILSRR